MSKLSVILPTMWIPNTVDKLLQDLDNHHLVSEIILIDNNFKKSISTISRYKKVNHLIQDVNIYVNPAWNLGWREANENLLLFINDDIYLDCTLLDKVVDKISPEIGMIGLGLECFSRKKKHNQSFNIIQVEKRTTGYGCLFFIHKDSYIEIPNELKIHYGDDYLFKYNGKRNYKITGYTVEGDISKTVSYIKPDKILTQDKNYWLTLQAKTK